MNRQEFDWGYVNWKGKLSKKVNIGISHIYPRTLQKEHRHYGNEQYIFVLSGRGTYIINGEEHRLQEGDGIYIPANATHSTINREDRKLVDLVVSSPIDYDKFLDKREFEREVEDGGDISKEILSLLGKELEILNFPTIILDKNDEIILFSSKFSSYCERECSIYSNLAKCDCINSHRRGQSGYSCNRDRCIYSKDLILDGEYMGRILIGFFDASYNLSSVSDSIDHLLDKLSKSIRALLDLNKIKRELYEKTRETKENRETLLSLEDSLGMEKEKTIDLKINYHFLFNTLNYIAGEALESDNLELYKAIIKLAELFRYTSTSVDSKEVDIYRELDMMKTYIDLQKLRYGDGLEYEVNIDRSMIDYKDSVGSIEIPRNTLQPIIENAFTHGFMDYDGKKYIGVDLRLEEAQLSIEIKNNGIKLDMGKLIDINNKIRDRERGHSLSMINRKLNMFYKKEIDFHLSSWEEGTKAVMKLPLERGK